MSVEERSSVLDLVSRHGDYAILSEKETASWLLVSTSTLRRIRRENEHFPKPVRLGYGNRTRIGFIASEIYDYLKSQRQEDVTLI